jgi:predicted anti-sigma-YlaC factor YlaD
MDCALIREELFAYHFGAASDAERDRIDAHLLECGDCLRAYLTLKRRLESGAASEKPSDEVRARLRADVEKKFRPKQHAKMTSIFQRRIPLYQGIVAVALAAAFTLALPRAYRAAEARGRSGQSAEPNVDTARPSAESLSIF